VILFRFLTQVPALVAIGLWIAFQVISSLAADPTAGGVAYLAHIGGFAAGVVVGFLFRVMPQRSRAAWP
jgi:membrane associated rhomboid family serine protease